MNHMRVRPMCPVLRRTDRPDGESDKISIQFRKHPSRVANKRNELHLAS